MRLGLLAKTKRKTHRVITVIVALLALFRMFALKQVSAKPFDQSFLDRTSFTEGCTGVV